MASRLQMPFFPHPVQNADLWGHHFFEWLISLHIVHEIGLASTSKLLIWHCTSGPLPLPCASPLPLHLDFLPPPAFVDFPPLPMAAFS